MRPTTRNKEKMKLEMLLGTFYHGVFISFFAVSALHWAIMAERKISVGTINRQYRVWMWFTLLFGGIGLLSTAPILRLLSAQAPQVDAATVIGLLVGGGFAIAIGKR
jgi:hypothetical protein